MPVEVFVGIDVSFLRRRVWRLELVLVFPVLRPAINAFVDRLK